MREPTSVAHTTASRYDPLLVLRSGNSGLSCCDVRCSGQTSNFALRGSLPKTEATRAQENFYLQNFKFYSASAATTNTASIDLHDNDAFQTTSTATRFCSLSSTLLSLLYAVLFSMLFCCSLLCCSAVLLFCCSLCCLVLCNLCWFCAPVVDRCLLIYSMVCNVFDLCRQ